MFHVPIFSKTRVVNDFFKLSSTFVILLYFMTSTCHFNCLAYIHFFTILKSECTGKANMYALLMQHENGVIMGRMMLVLKNFSKEIPTMCKL
jgi:hypothetical protein